MFLFFSGIPLEPGEIDVNYVQYKKCFHNHWKNSYRRTLGYADSSSFET